MLPRHIGGLHNARVRRRRRRGAGTVYRSDRGWIARFPLGSVDGRRMAKRERCRTEGEALNALERMRRIYGAGGSPATGTIGEYLDEWLIGWEDVRESTRVSYAGHIRNHIKPLLGGIPVIKLQSADIRRLIADLRRKGRKPGTIVRVVTTLRIALNAAVGERSITDNPAAHVRLPLVELDPVRPLTHDEADAILTAVVGTWIGPVVRVLLGSGLRLGEVLGLDQRDLMLPDGFVRIRVSKTQVRAVPISADAVDALREAMAAAPRRGADEPVFFGPRKSRHRLRGSSVSHALPRILIAAGLDRLAPHALRHGAATLMLADGHPMRVIAEQLGHRNPSLTARTYAHVLPESQRAAVGSLERRKAR